MRPDRIRAGRPGGGAAVKRVLLLAAAAAVPACGAAPAGLLGIAAGSGKGAASLSVPMQVVVLLTLLTLLPAAVVSVTPFLRIAVVLHFLRQALGTQSTPSNQVLLGLALFLTILIMQPVAAEIYQKAWAPLESGAATLSQALDEGSKPLHRFLIRFAREKDLQLLLEISHTPAPKTPAELGLQVLVPAYVLSELKAGFQIGAVLFLPFLVIDLVVASVTLSIGMVQLPPVMISAPFKVLLFVLVDGWNLVVGSLVRSFY
jgi:flagellar biosynthetic protein FliP